VEDLLEPDSDPRRNVHGLNAANSDTLCTSCFVYDVMFERNDQEKASDARRVYSKRLARGSTDLTLWRILKLIHQTTAPNRGEV